MLLMVKPSSGTATESDHSVTATHNETTTDAADALLLHKLRNTVLNYFHLRRQDIARAIFTHRMAASSQPGFPTRQQRQRKDLEPM